MNRIGLLAALLIGMAGQAPGAELLTNTGFENSTYSPWIGNGCSLAKDTTQYHSGSASCRAYSRNPSSDGPQYPNLKTALINNGRGTYTVSAWLKLASGTDTGRIQIGLRDDTGDTYPTVSGSVAVSNTGWTLVAGTVDLNWVGTLTLGNFFVNTASSLQVLYVDDCSFQKTPVATPTLSPNGGLHVDSVEVTLASDTPEAVIYYTTNGTTPTTGSTLYSAPFTLTGSAPVKAFATKVNMPDSEVADATFTVVQAAQVVVPTITPNGGTTIESVLVTLESLTEGASISYTTNGTAPTTASSLYTVPFTLTSSATIKAFAWKSGMTDSDTATADFKVTVATPTVSPNGGAFADNVEVSLACTTEGAAISFTTNGTTPTPGSTLYTVPFTLTSSATVKALAWKSGLDDSLVASAGFLYTVHAPTISPDSGMITGSVVVTLSCDTPGASIRFTSDGTTPGASSGYVTYTVPFISVGGLVKAYAYRTNDASSAVVTADYTNTAPAPWTVIGVPGRVEAEHYRAGAEGTAYHDTTSGNGSHMYRNDRVDIEQCFDLEGGYNIGLVAAGEWLTYNLNVDRPANYRFVYRVASAVAGTKTLSSFIDDVQVATASCTNSDGWQSFHDVTVGPIALSSGSHLLKINFDTVNINLNYLDVLVVPGRGALIMVK